jgi:uncharacterized integral membrane protein
MSYLIVAVLAVAVAVFAMQNTTPVAVKFLAWEIPDVPVAGVVLGSLAAGLVIAGLPLWFRLWRARRRARLLEDAADRAAREAAAVRPAPSPPLPPPAASGGAPSPGRPDLR